MTEATATILQQWGVAGALLIVAGYVIVRLWTDSRSDTRKTIEQLSEREKALTEALAICNAGRLTDYQAMNGALTTSARAQEASTLALAEVKQSLRDVAEELRRSKIR